MDIMEAIYTRRSIRKYQNQTIPKELMQKLLEAAVMAPSGSNAQAWAFAVVQDPGLLKSYSDRAKVIFLEILRKYSDPQNYIDTLANPEFNIFYDAGNLVVIYGDSKNPTAVTDCSMAAQNLMLAAHAARLGSCWIGFSGPFFDSEECKKELGIPEHFKAIAPIILGYPEVVPESYKRESPQVLVWK